MISIVTLEKTLRDLSGGGECLINKRLTAFVYIFISCFLFFSPALNAQNLQIKGGGKHNGVMRMAQFDGDKGTFMYAYTNATRKGSVMFVDRCGQIHVLSESSPDAANEKLVTVNATLTLKNKADAEAFANSMNKIHELGKRNASVNIIRDQLYKLNELINNLSFFDCETVEQSGEKKATKKDVILKKALSVHSYLSSEQIVDLYKSAFDNIKEIAIAEFKAETTIIENKVALVKAETEYLNAQIQISDSLKKLNDKINQLNTKIAELNTKLEKAKNATEEKEKAIKERDKANEEKALAIKIKEEYERILKNKSDCCK